jgi:hypothetical protein
MKQQYTGQEVPLPEHVKTGKRRKESIEKQKQTVAANIAIKNAIYEELRTQLASGNKTFYAEFIEKYLKAAKKDPNSSAGKKVADIILQQNVLDLLDEQHKKEMAENVDFIKYKLFKQFFNEQREVLYEINHSKRIICCCSRRAGKTDLASGAINIASMLPNTRIIYVNLTYTNALTQVFENVIERSEKSGLSISSSSKSNGEIEWSNGSSLRICGNSNNAEIDKLRGEKRVSLVIIDEFFHQRNMEYAINEVIFPLMLDIPNSTILCLGTPPRIPKTYGEKIWTTEKGWKKFHWTAEENPYIDNFEEFIDDICKSKGLTRDAPFIQREYYGIVGMYDKESQVMKDYKTYSTDAPLDFVPDRVDIGLDFGFEDNNAIIALAYNNEKARVIEERKFNRASASEIIKQVQEVYSNSKKFLIENNRNANINDVNIYCDTNAKELVYELYSVQKLPAYCAYKYNKQLAISQMSEFCRTGKIVVPQDGILADEFDRILYKRDDEDNILSEIDEDLYHGDAFYALLYAVRQMWYQTGNELGGESSETWE